MFRAIKELNYSNYTILIPSVSVGNVGQLTCDLIISTLNLQKTGTIWHKGLIPIYGANPFDNSSTVNCTACELYANEDLKLAVLQIRSSIERKFLTQFLTDLKSWLIEQKFPNVFILTSTHSYELHNITSGYYRYLTNRNDQQQTFEDNKILQFHFENQRIVHGSGFALKLYDLLIDSIPVTVLIKYTSEGDNRPDAVSMLMILQKCLSLQSDIIETIAFPTSWNLVYGNPPPIGIY